MVWNVRVIIKRIEIYLIIFKLIGKKGEEGKFNLVESKKK